MARELKIIRMPQKETTTTEDSSDLYCPTCGKARDDIQNSPENLFETFYCLNCGQALGVGVLFGLKVICPKCNSLVVVG